MSLHSHVPLKGLCHFQINGCPKPLRTAKGFLKVLSSTPTLNYFYFIPSSISSNGYPEKVFKTFFTAAKMVLPKSAALGNAPADWSQLLLLRYHSFPCMCNALSAMVLQHCTTLALGLGCSSKCQADFLLH